MSVAHRFCAAIFLYRSPASCSGVAFSHMPALRVSESKRLRLRLRLTLGKGVWGEPHIRNLLEPEQRVNQPNIQKPKGAMRHWFVASPKGMVAAPCTSMQGIERMSRIKI
jgi:hypothetical protein